MYVNVTLCIVLCERVSMGRYGIRAMYVNVTLCIVVCACVFVSM